MTPPIDTQSAAASVAVPQLKTSVPADKAARRWRYFATPIMLGLVALALYLWASSLSLDSIEARSVNREAIWRMVEGHLKITAVSTIFVILIAVSLGVLLTRSWARHISAAVVAVAGIGQAIPSIGLLALLAILFTIGFKYALIALVLYSIPPVLRNTMVGLQQVDRSLIEAGRGMGMTKGMVLRRIELPLAVPVMLAGIRTALIINVGTATLATFVGWSTLGDMINNGLRLGRPDVVLIGGALTAIIALTLDWLASVVEDVLRPRGL